MPLPESNELNPISVTSNQQYGFGYSTIPQNVILVAGVAQTITVPEPDINGNQYTKISLNATENLWVNFNGQIAVVPSVNVGPSVDGMVLNPSTKYIRHLLSISMISAVDNLVSIEWFV